MVRFAVLLNLVVFSSSHLGFRKHIISIHIIWRGNALEVESRETTSERNSLGTCTIMMNNVCLLHTIYKIFV